MLTFFITFVTTFTGLLGVIWSKKKWLDVAFKTILLAQAFMGGYLIYTMKLFG